MSKYIDLQIVQKVDSTFVIYDDTDRTYYPSGTINYADLVDRNPNTPFIYFRFTSPGGVNYDTVIADTEVTEVTVPTTINWKNGSSTTVGTVIDGLTNLDFTSLQQDEFTIEVSNIGDVSEGFWYVEYYVFYYDGLGLSWFSDSYNELACMELELYRAKRFEEIAQNSHLFANVDKRFFTNDEVKFLGLMVFDTYFKALRSAAVVGNMTSAESIYEYLAAFKLLNPLDDDSV